MAVSENKLSIIQLLLAKGKNLSDWIDAKDDLDSTPLLLAIRRGTHSHFADVISKICCAHPSSFAESVAAFFWGGTHAVVNMLLNGGADPHKSPDCLPLTVINQLDNSLGYLVLLSALEHCHMSHVYRFTPLASLVLLLTPLAHSLLIDKANDPSFVNSRNDEGATALLVAAALGRREMVQTLISKGADPAIASNDGITSLHCGMSQLYVAGVSPLHSASARGHMDVCTMLLQAGAKANSYVLLNVFCKFVYPLA